MSEPPDTVDIGPHRYVIDTSNESALLLRDEDSRGDSRPDRLLIRLDPDRPPTAVAETLLHELLHAAWALTSLRATADLNEHEEAIVTALAPWLLDILRRNPDLVDFLTE